MKLLLCGNCVVDPLAKFLRRALSHFEIRHLPHLATFYGEFTEEQIAAEHAWADLVFFHHKHDGAQDYPTKQPKIPLSVWYQGGPFIIQAHEESWETVREYARQHGTEAAIEWAVKEHDMGYHRRWDSCVAKMMQKEQDEQVPSELLISDLMAEGRMIQTQLTCNHPTSFIFREWALRIVSFLGEKPGPDAVSAGEALTNPNLGGLPCEESATTGAVKALGLSWGGRPEDDESGRQVARERLAL